MYLLRVYICRHPRCRIFRLHSDTVCHRHLPQLILRRLPCSGCRQYLLQFNISRLEQLPTKPDVVDRRNQLVLPCPDDRLVYAPLP